MKRLATAVGVDLAWSPSKQSGLAIATVQPGAITITRAGVLQELEEIVDVIGMLKPPMTIAVDAPTIVPNRKGARPVERELQHRFSPRHAGPYPANRRLLGRYNGDQPRGEELVEKLRDTVGARDEGLPPARHRGIRVIEVFPAPALVQLFGLGRALPYKKRRGRSWPQCQVALKQYRGLLETLTGPRLKLPSELVVGYQAGAAFKRLEDQIDACFCAYLAGLPWLDGARRLEMVGSVRQRYIVLPRRLGD